MSELCDKRWWRIYIKRRRGGEPLKLYRGKHWYMWLLKIMYIQCVWTEGKGYNPNHVLRRKPILVRRKGKLMYGRLAHCVWKGKGGGLEWLTGQWPV